MRFFILLGAFLIASAIRPEMFTTKVIVDFVFLCLIAIFCDVVESGNNNRRK